MLGALARIVTGFSPIQLLPLIFFAITGIAGLCMSEDAWAVTEYQRTSGHSFGGNYDQFSTTAGGSANVSSTLCNSNVCASNSTYLFYPGTDHNTSNTQTANPQRGWATINPVNTTISAGTWTFKWAVEVQRYATGGNATVSARVFRATNGTSGTLLFTVNGSRNYATATSAAVAETINSVQPAYVLASNEYLIVEYWLNYDAGGDYAFRLQSNTANNYVIYPDDSTAPIAVSDLATSNPQLNAIDLAWTAPGDDINTGTASSYDIRYSTSIINDANWSSATQVIGEPSPSVAGSSESFTVTGLSASTTYYFAIKTDDEIPNTSALSNIPSAATSAPDVTAPAAISDLATGAATVSTIELTWTAVGDDGTTGTATSYDIRYSTSNISNDTDFNNATQVTGDPSPKLAGSGESFTVTGLSAATSYYFAIKVADEAPNSSTLSNVPSTSTNASDTTAPAAVIDLSGSAISASSIDLTWTAPGDDGNSGTATSYDIRYSTSVITSGNWASATQVTGEPSPSAAGSSESITISSLSSDTTYYFAIKTVDEVPNESNLSDNTVATTDGTGSGGNVTYYAKMSNGVSIASGITTDSGSCGNDPPPDYTEEFSTDINDMCVTNDAYRAEQDFVGTHSNHYYNTAYGTATTVTGVSYQVTIRDGGTVGFQLFYVTAAGSKTYLGSEVTQTNTDNTTNNYIIDLSGQSGSVPPGAKLGLRTRGIAVNPNFRIYLGNLDDRTSNISGKLTVNELTGNSSDTTAPDAVSDLATGMITPSSIALSWTAPGDDGNTGTATVYDIRYSTAMITAGNWASATQVSGEPTPSIATTSESMTVTGLLPNNTYYFAIKTLDEVPNSSTLSNVVSATTYDPPVGGYATDNVIPTAQVSQATDGTGVITINWKGRDNQSDNVSLNSFEYSVDGGSNWNTPTNADASASLSSNWDDNGGSNWSTATTLAAATAHSFSFNTKHADASSLVDVDQSDVQVRFNLNDGGMDSISVVTSENFQVDNFAPTATVTSATYTPATDTMVITGTNFTTIAAASTDIKTYVDWSKFVWDINADNATTANISFIAGDVTSLTVTNATTLTLVFTSSKGTAIESTSGYGSAGGADSLDVAAGFSIDYFGNTASTDAVADAVITTPEPNINVTKLSSVISDPISTSNPKRIPGAIIQYIISVSNSGNASPDANSTIVISNIDTSAEEFDFATGVIFTDGATTSNLTMGTVVYSDDSGASYTYNPSGGFDPNVTNIQVPMTGTFAYGGLPAASFSIKFYTLIK